MAGRYKTVAQLLRDVRTSQGKLLGEVANDVGISASQLSRIERGERRYDEDTAQRLALYYGLSAQEMALAGGAVPEDVIEILRRNPCLLEELRARYGRTGADE